MEKDIESKERNAKNYAPTVFFDGDCTLCNKSVQFVINYDKKETIRFCSLQSERAKILLNNFILEHNGLPNSIILYWNNQFYIKGEAIIHLLKLLNRFWFIIGTIIGLIPLHVVNYFYDFIAKHRLQLLGKSNYCMLQTPKLSNRFLN